MMIIPVLVYCGNNTDDHGIDPESDPVITLDGEKEFTISCEGGTGSFKVTSNIDWTAVPGASWIKVTPESGVASETPVTITFSCEKILQKKNRSSDIQITGAGAMKYVDVVQLGDPMAGAAEELKSGSTVLATNPLVEKFLTEVTYKDWPEEDSATRKTKIFDYPGGFDGVNLTWDNWGKEWPDGDIPCQ